MLLWSSPSQQVNVFSLFKLFQFCWIRSVSHCCVIVKSDSFFWDVTGCHQVSFAVVATVPDPDPESFCLPRDTSSPISFDNALAARWTRGDDRVSFSMCSDTVSYVRCSVLFWVPGPISVIFSTVSIPLQTPLTPTANTPSASFSYQQSLTAMSPLAFGDKTVGRVCADFFGGCYNWLVPPISDPLIFWPPPSQLPKFDNEGTNVYGDYYKAMNAQPLDKTLIGVFILTVGTREIIPRSRLNEVSMALTYITNELGEAPQLPNNAPDGNEKTQASPSQYLPTISLESFPVVNLADLCDETNYDNLQNVVNSELEQILASDSLETIEFHKVCFLFFFKTKRGELKERGEKERGGRGGWCVG